MWRRMNVAMNGPELSSETEDLPLPESANHSIQSSDPFTSDPEGYYLDGGMEYPSCGPDGCSGPCGCGDVCGCGDACEPGCGCGCGGYCEPGCAYGDQACNDCFCIGPGDPEACNTIRLRVPKWQEANIFFGVQGFKNPYDLDRDSGNFGFHEGFNIGAKIPYTFVGYQVGYQAVQSQLNGDEATNDPESRTQHFTTLGLFRRNKDGLQFGSAWDTLVDERHNARTFHQIRSEISWLDCGTHEFGFNATVGIMDHEDNDDQQTVWQTADQYLLFYRLHGKRGGEGRFYAGFSDDSDGIIGSDLLIPVHDRWSINTGFTYLIPDARDGADGASEEAWNINLGLVWHWGCTARSSHCNPYRPLFNVANNGYMILDRRDNNVANNGAEEAIFP